MANNSFELQFVSRPGSRIRRPGHEARKAGHFWKNFGKGSFSHIRFLSPLIPNFI